MKERFEKAVQMASAAESSSVRASYRSARTQLPTKLDSPWISASMSSQAKFPQADECMCEVVGIYQAMPCSLFHGIRCGSSVHPFVLLQETPSKLPYLAAISQQTDKRDLMAYQVSYSVITAMAPFTLGLRHINRVLWESRCS